MLVHNILQGSTSWNSHRAQSRNASEAPALMGASKYMTRTELLRQKATGITEEIDSYKQSLFDRGHEAESMARIIVESMISEDLYPVVGQSDDGYLSASFDGVDISNTIGFEHKLFSESLVEAVRNKELPPAYYWQLEQQILVGGLEKIIFVCSDGTRENFEWMEYRAVPGRAEQLIAAWRQFDIDLENYVPPEVITPVVASPTLNLPTVSVQVKGAIELISNLPKFGTALKEFISNIPASPSTDQEFADCKSAIGKLQDAQDALDAAEAHALGQIVTFDEMKREKTLWFDLARTTRLALEKLVAKREAEIKLEIVQGGRDGLAEHIHSLNQRLGKPYMPSIVADWAAAIKSKRTVASLQNAVDTLLANKKIEASAIADKIEINLKSLREIAVDYGFLFSDTSSIVMKANEDLVMLINSRINDHKAMELAKAEAIRAAIAEEERIKAEAKARAEQAEIAAKERAEQASIAEARRKALAEQAATAERERARLEQDQRDIMSQYTEAKPVPTDVAIYGGGSRQPVSTMKVAQPSPTLTLGKIGTRLGFSITADFLRSIGFEPAAKERAAVLYHETSWPAICAELIEHIRTVRDGQQQAA